MHPLSYCFIWWWMLSKYPEMFADFHRFYLHLPKNAPIFFHWYGGIERTSINCCTLKFRLLNIVSKSGWHWYSASSSCFDIFHHRDRHQSLSSDISDASHFPTIISFSRSLLSLSSLEDMSSSESTSSFFHPPKHLFIGKFFETNNMKRLANFEK